MLFALKVVELDPSLDAVVVGIAGLMALAVIPAIYCKAWIEYEAHKVWKRMKEMEMHKSGRRLD